MATKFFVEGDVGGSGVLLGEFSSAREALQFVLDFDKFSTTPEVVEMWIRVSKGGKSKGYSAPWAEYLQVYNLEIEARCSCGMCLAGACSQCEGAPPLYIVKEIIRQ